MGRDEGAVGAGKLDKSTLADVGRFAHRLGTLGVVTPALEEPSIRLVQGPIQGTIQGREGGEAAQSRCIGSKRQGGRGWNRNQTAGDQVHVWG